MSEANGAEDVGENERDTIEVEIRGHSKVCTHMETFLLYDVVISGSKGPYSVSRRYGDFDWLWHLLMERYPMAIIPPLPHKHSITTIERFVGDFIQQRQTSLCQFLRRLISHPIVGLDNDFWLFLTLSTSAFIDHKKGHPVLGKLEMLLQSLNSLTTGSTVISEGGCVDNLYKLELEKSVEHTIIIGNLLHRLERVVSRSSENMKNIGHTAVKGASQLNNWGVLFEVGEQYKATSNVIKERIEPWVTECSLYCAQAEKSAHRREAIEAKFAATEKTLSRGSLPHLETSSNQLHDSLSQSNAYLKSEFDRWETEKSVETKLWLTTFADVHVDHFQRTSDIWRQLISTLHLQEDCSDFNS